VNSLGIIQEKVISVLETVGYLNFLGLQMKAAGTCSAKVVLS
jgi:hypothetical protein